jgi:hypothetical protein
MSIDQLQIQETTRASIWVGGELSQYTVEELLEQDPPGALLEILSRASDPKGMGEIREWWESLPPETQQEYKNRFADPEPVKTKPKSRGTNALQSRKLRAIIWNKTGGKCWYCNRQTNPWTDFCIDHVVPISSGGTDDLDNLVPCCRPCNASKGGR